MKRIRIQHDTHYDYTEAVGFGPQELMIRPRSGHDVRIEHSELRITPEAKVKWRRDVYGNSVGVATIVGESKVLSICSEVILQHFENEPLDFLVDEHAVYWPFQFDPRQRLDLAPFQILCFPNDGEALRTWVGQFWQPGQTIETYTLLDNMNKAIVQDFEYRMREEPGVQTPAETLALKTGSCRDFANLFIEACRYLGLPARFVSGYLHCPETVQGHGSTHAWSEVYLPGAGWKGFDNTSGIVVGRDHIAVAVCRHPEDAPPISGSLFGSGRGKASMRVKVDVVELPADNGAVQKVDDSRP
ncbi:MAG: transglutaminase family protein [Luteolibacter sp.]